MKLLTYPQRRLLRCVEQNPGHSRSELGKMLYPDMNPVYSNAKVSVMVRCLAKKNLLKLDTIREGGRLGVPGVYLVNQKVRENVIYGVFGLQRPG